MSERTPEERLPDDGLINLDYFYGQESAAEKRNEFLRRNIIPTNNLYLYIVDEPAEEISPGTGINNPFNYKQKPFFAVLENFRLGHPGLWQESIDMSEKLLKSLSDTSGRPEASSAESKDLYWQHAELHDKIFRILAPELKIAGIKPIEVCK